jgi:hypothetical protein
MKFKGDVLWVKTGVFLCSFLLKINGVQTKPMIIGAFSSFVVYLSIRD